MPQVAKTKENLKKCQCMKCPSYTLMCKMKAMPKNIIGMMGDISKKDHFEGLYCAFEASKCIKDKKSCICGTCPVFKENGLMKNYYCIIQDSK